MSQQHVSVVTSYAKAAKGPDTGAGGSILCNANTATTFNTLP